MTDPHAVCRYYDGSGALLYVGMTTDPCGALCRAIKRAPWGHEIAGHAVEWHADRAAALAARAAAVKAGAPRHNRGPSIREAQCRACAEAGMTVAEAARELGVTYNAVYRIAREHSLSFRPGRLPNGFVARRAVEMRAAGWTPAEIARSLGTSRGSVKSALYRARAVRAEAAG